MTPSSETYSITISSRIASASLHAGRRVGRIEHGCNGLPSPSHSTCACARGAPPYARAPAPCRGCTRLSTGSCLNEFVGPPLCFHGLPPRSRCGVVCRLVPPIQRSLPRALRGDGSVGAGEELDERRRENVGRHLV